MNFLQEPFVMQVVFVLECWLVASPLALKFISRASCVYNFVSSELCSLLIVFPQSAWLELHCVSIMLFQSSLQPGFGCNNGYG